VQALLDYACKKALLLLFRLKLSITLRNIRFNYCLNDIKYLNVNDNHFCCLATKLVL